jgi:hypothetical protein
MVKNFMSLLVGALILAAFQATASGQAKEKGVGIAGTEIPAAQRKQQQSSCYVYDRYVVKTTETADGVGEEIRVSLRGQSSAAAAACDVKGAATHYLIENDDSNFFFGISGDYLFVDVGTGPEPRELRIYDLARKKRVYTASYSEPIKVSGGLTLDYYQALEKELPRSQCPQAGKWEKEGLGFGFEQRVVLDLATLKEQKIGRPRCSPRQ